jgi:hypothetical protein
LSQPSPKTTRPASPLGKVIATLALLVIIVGGFWLYNTLSEVGLTGLFKSGNTTASAAAFRLKKQPVYQVKKKQDLLGINVVRIISRQQPEEFLVLDGISRRLVDKIYGRSVDLSWANLMANQLLRLRESGEDASPVSVEIQKIRTLKPEMLPHQTRKLPYWQVEVQFKLSNESAPRYYEAGIIRNARTAEPATDSESASASGKDTLVIGYAQKEAFQKDLVSDLLGSIEFDKN